MKKLEVGTKTRYTGNRIDEAIRVAMASPEGGAKIGAKRPNGGSAFTLPEAIAFTSELPPASSSDGTPVGWGLYPPIDMPVVVTLQSGHKSGDKDRQWIKRGAEGWIVCMWSRDTRMGRVVVVRVGFNPSTPGKEHRFVDVPDTELDRIKSLGGRPLDYVGWELRRL